MPHNKEPCQVSLPFEWGTVPQKRLATLYYKILCKKLGTKALINWGKVTKLINTTLGTHTEMQVSALLIAHMNYNPTVYPFDKWTVDNLPKTMYPIELFIKNYNVYIGYLIYDRHVEFDNLDKIKELVYKYVDTLA